MNDTHALTAFEAVSAVARSDLDGVELLLEAADRVRRVVPFDAAGLMIFDPVTLLPLRSAVLGLADVDVLKLLRNDMLSSDVLKFDELAHRHEPVATLSSLGAQAYESERRAEILRPIGIGDEMRVVFRHDGSLWGAACIMRATDAAEFDAHEIAFVREIAAVVGRALQRSLLRGAAVAGAADPGVMLVNRGLQVVSVAESARRWQRLLPEESMIAVRSVALRAHDPAATETNRRAHIRLNNGEWLTAHSATLDEEPGASGLIAVMLAPAGDRDLAQLMVRIHGLSTRESEIANLLLNGLSPTVNAQRLSISGHTMRTHMKSIFSKLGVNSRAQLMATLTGHPVAADPRESLF